MTETIQPGSFTASLAILFERGVRFGTVIDIGCADGSFVVYHAYLGVLPDAVPVNIDANAFYESSLKAIQEVLGGYYLITALGDHAGEAEMTIGAHPYWSSLRPVGDNYWQQHNNLYGDKTKVPLAKLDDVAEKLNLKPPFLLKLDVQGAEIAALRGASQALTQTDAVICEILLDDFEGINSALVEKGFGLFDLTEITRLADRSLGYFYAVYTSRRMRAAMRPAFWKPEDSARILRLQEDRRVQVIESNAQMLAELKKQRLSES